jgi:acyl-CoA reductase-like NAD-dependent aldehyde dehydrogenase
MVSRATANNWTPVTADMLIGGKWIGSNLRIEVFNPARPDELVGTIARGTPDDVGRAVAAAKTAQPGWAAMTYAARAEVLSRVLDRLVDDMEERAVLFVRENGKTLPEARGELAGMTARQRLTLELAPELDRMRELAAPNGRSFVGYLPFGVVVSIVPWNTPVGLACLQIIPALLAGNAIVLKPPETCPLSLIRAVEMIAPLLPPGLINIVTGMPGEIGDALTTHPDVGKVAFTGSVPSARKIMANAAQTIKGITLELGGNDAAILLDDADLGEASMSRMTTAVYRMTGQVCMGRSSASMCQNQLRANSWRLLPERSTESWSAMAWSPLLRWGRCTPRVHWTVQRALSPMRQGAARQYRRLVKSPMKQRSAAGISCVRPL